MLELLETAQGMHNLFHSYARPPYNNIANVHFQASDLYQARLLQGRNFSLQIHCIQWVFKPGTCRPVAGTHLVSRN